MYYLRLFEFLRDFADEPFEGCRGESELLRDAFGAEPRTDEDFHQQCGVIVRLDTDSVISSHNHQRLTQVRHT